MFISDFPASSRQKTKAPRSPDREPSREDGARERKKIKIEREEKRDEVKEEVPESAQSPSEEEVEEEEEEEEAESEDSESDSGSGNMSCIVRKPAFYICENKDVDQLRGKREADQHLCFRYTDSTIPLLAKSKISSLSPSSVAVQPGLCGTRSKF